jgi:TrmH family RNA methyltransferase
LIEGLQQVGAAIESGWEVDALLYSENVRASSFGRDLVASFAGKTAEVTPDVLASIAGREHPQGIVAVGRQRRNTLGSRGQNGYSAALVSPQDPGNVGTILRTLDAVGGSGLYLLDGGADPYHPTAVRASMGAAFTIPVVEASVDDFLTWRRTQGIRLIGTTASAGHDYRDEQPSPPWILLFGSEQKGLSEAHRDACDVLVSLPMRGRTSSLNLAVAAGILLFAYTR